MLSRATVPQPTFKALYANFAGPFAVWQQGPNEARLQWPSAGEHRGGYSMEVRDKCKICEKEIALEIELQKHLFDDVNFYHPISGCEGDI